MTESSKLSQQALDQRLGFAEDDDQPIRYMQRTRDWYLGLGYGKPYRWAHFSDAPFTSLRKPLKDTCVAIVTTAAPYQPDKGNQGPGSLYNSAAKFFTVYSGDTTIDHDLRVSHVAIDRKHTSMQDCNTWFALPMLRALARDNVIGSIAPFFYGAPTNRSQRHTIEVDAPEVLKRCRADGVEAVVLIPNCPVCHQTLSLIARHLEAGGIPTVLIGCAKDIVEHCGVPRFLFSDFPLGNAAGKPHDLASQRQTLELALNVLEAAPGARTTMQSPLRWSDSHEWKLDYSNIDRVSPEELIKLKQEFDQGKEVAQSVRDQQLTSAFRDLTHDHEAIKQILIRLNLAQGTETVTVKPLTGGVSSNIFHVTTSGAQYCLKQALPKLKVAKEWLAPVDRVFAEIDWLQTATKIVPKHVPHVLGVDRDSKSFVMQYLGTEYLNWKTELLAGRVTPGVAAQVGQVLGQIHAQTARQADIAQRFANDATFYAIRLEPYLAEAARQHPDQSAHLKALIKRTQSHPKVLVHGDVSPKNILLGPAGPVLLDAECAWYGDPAFDVAFCLNHLFLKTAHNPQAGVTLMNDAQDLLTAYLKHVTWEPEHELEHRIVTLLPGLMLARVDGKSPVEYLNSDRGARVRKLAIEFLNQTNISFSMIHAQWGQEFKQ